MMHFRTVRQFLQRDWAWAALFCLTVIGFYPELFFVKAAPLVNDHWEQHYPWAALLHKTLAQGRLPFWTPLIHYGFPIAAESQIGIFYLPNLLLSLLFPFPASYAYTVLIHFMISGIGTALSARSIGLARPAAWFAAILFVFGTSYGGAYYNLTSLKTIAWFPWLLWFFEEGMKKRHAGFMALWGLAASQLLVAGYLQVGALVIGMAGIYAGLRLFWIKIAGEFSGSMVLRCGWLAGALGLCVMLSLGQILLTLPLALMSNRTGLVEEYAYVGSLSPLALFTLLLPNLQGLFRGNCLYSGGFAVFALLAACLSQETRRSLAFRIWAAMAVVSLLLALGRWSPLYVALIKLTHFSSFRTPAKFLIFFNFATVLLAACGFQALLESQRQMGLLASRAAKGFMTILAALLAAVFAVKVFLGWGRPVLSQIGEFFLRNTIYGRAGHSHSYQEYLGKLESMLQTGDLIFSFHYPWTVWMTVVLSAYALWAFAGLKLKRRDWLWLASGLLLLFLDLYGCSSADMRTDFAAFPSGGKSLPVQALQKASREGRLGRVMVFKARDSVPELAPSANMLFDVAVAGAYSPFVISRYFQTLGRFGGVNDSNHEFVPDKNFMLQRLELLRAFGVTHIFSIEEMRDVLLELVESGGPQGPHLYRIENSVQTEGYLAGKFETFSDWETLKARLMGEHFDPRETVLLEDEDVPAVLAVPLGNSGDSLGEIRSAGQRDDHVRLELDTAGAAFFVRPVTFYPGWKARINGREARIYRAYGLFQAVYLPDAGRYTLEFEYDPWLALRTALPSGERPQSKIIS